jgi:hypothetical protein
MFGAQRCDASRLRSLDAMVAAKREIFDAEVHGKPATLAQGGSVRHAVRRRGRKTVAWVRHSTIAALWQLGGSVERGLPPRVHIAPSTGRKNMSHQEAALHIDHCPTSIDDGWRHSAPSRRGSALSSARVAPEKRNCPIPFNHQGKVIRKTSFASPSEKVAGALPGKF